MCTSSASAWNATISAGSSKYKSGPRRPTVFRNRLGPRDDVRRRGLGLERSDLGGIEQIQIRTAPSDDFAQSVGAGFARLGLELSLRLFDCFFEALPADRLQQVGDRAHLERFERVPLISGYEDDQRRGLPAQGAHDGETVELRHLEIQQHDIGPEIENARQCLRAVGRFTRELQRRDRFYVLAQNLPRDRLVVGDQHPQWTASAGRTAAVGIVNDTALPCVFDWMSSWASAPQQSRRRRATFSRPTPDFHPFWVGKPAPVSRTVMRRAPCASRRASSLSSPPRAWGEMPCLTAFSTSG